MESNNIISWRTAGALVVVLALAVLLGFGIYRSQHASLSLSRIIAAPSPALVGQQVSFGDAVVKTINGDDIVFWVSNDPLAQRGLLVYANFDLQRQVHLI